MNNEGDRREMGYTEDSQSQAFPLGAVVWDFVSDLESMAAHTDSGCDKEASGDSSLGRALEIRELDDGTDNGIYGIDYMGPMDDTQFDDANMARDADNEPVVLLAEETSHTSHTTHSNSGGGVTGGSNADGNGRGGGNSNSFISNNNQNNVSLHSAAGRGGGDGAGGAIAMDLDGSASSVTGSSEHSAVPPSRPRQTQSQEKTTAKRSRGKGRATEKAETTSSGASSSGGRCKRGSGARSMRDPERRRLQNRLAQQRRRERLKREMQALKDGKEYLQAKSTNPSKLTTLRRQDLSRASDTMATWVREVAESAHGNSSNHSNHSNHGNSSNHGNGNSSNHGNGSGGGGGGGGGGHMSTDAYGSFESTLDSSVPKEHLPSRGLVRKISPEELAEYTLTVPEGEGMTPDAAAAMYSSIVLRIKTRLKEAHEAAKAGKGDDDVPSPVPSREIVELVTSARQLCMRMFKTTGPCIKPLVSGDLENELRVIQTPSREIRSTDSLRRDRRRWISIARKLDMTTEQYDKLMIARAEYISNLQEIYFNRKMLNAAAIELIEHGGEGGAGTLLAPMQQGKQVASTLDDLKANIEQEVLWRRSFEAKFFSIMRPDQIAVLMVESFPDWVATMGTGGGGGKDGKDGGKSMESTPTSAGGSPSVSGRASPTTSIASDSNVFDPKTATGNPEKDALLDIDKDVYDTINSYGQGPTNMAAAFSNLLFSGWDIIKQNTDSDADE